MSRLSNNFSFINRGQQTEQSGAASSEVVLSPLEQELLTSYVETIMANFALMHERGCKYDQPAIMAALGMDTPAPVAQKAETPQQPTVATDSAMTFPLNMVEEKRLAVEQAYEHGATDGQAAA